MKLIKHTYMTPKEKFAVGLRFTIPDNDVFYKLMQDPHGRDFVGFLNSGRGILPSMWPPLVKLR